MRWIVYFILAYLALGLQCGIAQAMTFHGAAPNLVLLAVIFIAINAPRDPALLGCLVLGLMQDLTSGQPMGLYALCYALVAMFVVSTQNVVYREHPLTHFTLAFVGGLLVAAVLGLHELLRPMSPLQYAGQALPVQRLSFVTLFYVALYTAILAPLLIGLLQKIKRPFQFQPSRKRLRGLR